MEASQVIDSKIGDEDTEKTDDRHDCNFFPGPASNHARMQQGSIDEPGDQRPGFFRVPAPVSSPGGVSPDRPCDYAKGQHKEPYGNHLIIEIIKDSLPWDEFQEGAVFFFFFQSF